MHEDQYEVMADCIRSDQVPFAAVMEIIRENPDFGRWYRERYANGADDSDLHRKRPQGRDAIPAN